MKKQSILVVAFLAVLSVFSATAQDAVGRRFAVVIGNGDYSELGKLKNPVNDATDMAASLRGLGFQVKLLTDADLASMEDAVIRLGNDLAQEAGSLGFFYYAGHGVQSGGINYLIPADARIASEAFLKTKALAAQSVLDTLQGARNTLNVVVLDACRDNPFSWGRSGAGRGLTVVGNQPPGSLIAYATSAGSVAQDGTGRNGVFTAELLKNLSTPGLEIGEVFKRTGAGVQAATVGKQNPAVYNQFFGNAYLAGQAAAGAAGTPAASPSSTKPRMTVAKTYGAVTVTARTAGTLYLDGGELGPLGAGASARLDDVETGDRVLEMRYPDGQSERTTVTVVKDGAAPAVFSHVRPVAPTLSGFPGLIRTQGDPSFSLTPPSSNSPGSFIYTSSNPSVAAVSGGTVTVTGSGTTTITASQAAAGNYTAGSISALLTVQPRAAAQAPAGTVFVKGGSFWMGSESGAFYDKPVHDVKVSDFYLSKTEVTQKEYAALMGSNPSGFKGDTLPVECVSWYDAVAYANKLSEREGLRPAYTISGTNVSCDWSANGWRLPTEAEWEYAARGGVQSKGYTYAGSNDANAVAWYTTTTNDKGTQPVGTKAANELGLYDMSGNVWEWCWDWYGSYTAGSQTDPRGPTSGSFRVARGGSWFRDASYARPAYRSACVPGYRDVYLGFRLVRPSSP